MQMNTLTRRSLVVTIAGLSAAGLAACSGGSSGASPTAAGTSTAAVTPKPAETAVDPDTATLSGPGCAAYTAENPSGSGSVHSMALTPAATAASNNPLLKTLTAAVSGKLNSKVQLTQTLNGGQYTIFAPVDSAFAKLSAKKMASLKKSKNAVALTKLLTYHVVVGQLDSKDVVGSQTTVEGGKVKVTGSAGKLKVNGANVICGGVRTANATIYLIDTVLTPPKS